MRIRSNTASSSRSSDASQLLGSSPSAGALISSPPTPGSVSASPSGAGKWSFKSKSKLTSAVERAKRVLPRSSSAPSLLASAAGPSTELSFEVVNRPQIARPIDIPSQTGASSSQHSTASEQLTNGHVYDAGSPDLPSSPPRREMPYPKGATPPSSPESALSSPTETVFLSAFQSPTSSQLELTLPAPRPALGFTALPHEVKLSVLAQLVEVRKSDYASDIRGVNAGARAGLRDLIRLGRVSRAFLALSRDGQLWSTISTRILTPSVARELLPRVSSGFLRTLDLERATGLTDPELDAAIERAKQEDGATSLTAVKLAGCALLSATAVARMVIFSPAIRELSLMGLQSVSAATMALLSPESCPNLTMLTVSRCVNLPASSLVHLVSTGQGERNVIFPSKLTTLEAAGLDGWAEGTLAALASGLPELRHLDLSYSGASLTDAAIGKAVVVSGEMQGVVRVRRGGNVDEWRRVLPWRVLKLSAARGLTDGALAKLVGTLPALEVLELTDLRRLAAGRGLVGLLSEAGGLPALRRLDVEGCVALEDSVLEQLHSARALTHLVISNCHALTEPAIQTLVERAPALSQLEADGTAISGETVAALLRQQRERRAREALISALDSPAVTTRFYREHASVGEIRPRAGFAGEGADRMAFHHRGPSSPGAHDSDGASVEGALVDELDPGRVTMRSYAGHLALDKAEERRQRRRRRDELARAEARERLRLARGEQHIDDGDELRGLCIIS